MALFPRNRRRRREREEDRLWSRLSAFAAALVIAALFALLSGVVRDSQFPRGVQSADRGGDTPHLSKREPLRALASADRKDANGTHATSDDGAVLPVSAEFAFFFTLGAVWASGSSYDGIPPRFWPAALPRAPPASA